ncbi:MAG: hypothetical protein FJ197_01095 [Gammaproteobacteria bacterium]|nr:hypothetical protein [Gammaproteobacteria bacterium]
MRGARRRREPLPLTALLLAVLAVGAIAYALFDFARAEYTERQAAKAEAAVAAALRAAQPKPRVAASTAPPEKRFGFYDMLPQLEVVVPEVDGDVRADKTAAPVTAPGVYVLQAGSYASQAEAAKVQARLTSLGISSQIQKIAVDDRQVHRVRIGPVEQLPRLNQIRQRLRNARIDALLIRVGE